METSNKTALYVSVPLDPSRRQIRLLRILSTEPTLVCRFDVASLDTSVTYCALSYVCDYVTWGLRALGVERALKLHAAISASGFWKQLTLAVGLG